MIPDEAMMREAIALAKEARAKGEYPIGSVVALNGKIIGAAHTAIEALADPTAHGEVLAIRKSAQHLGKRYLEGAVLYSTLEPCPMCTSAAIWAKCEAIVFGVSHEDAMQAAQKVGAAKSFRQIRLSSQFVAEHGTPHVEVIQGFMRSECLALIG